MGTHGTRFFVLALLASLPAFSADDSLFSCLERRAPAKILGCAEAELGPGPVDPTSVRRLATILPSAPSTVAELARRIGVRDRKFLERSPVLWAALLDLEGQARSSLGRPIEAAGCYQAALRLDGGATRFAWYPVEGEAPVWTSSLDIGSGRLLRAARVFLDAGDAGAAGEVLRQARRLGAVDEIEPLWNEVPGLPPILSAASREVTADEWYKPLIDLELPSLAGESIRLPAEVRGQVVLVSFWASWCEPCARELPRLQAIYESERERGLRLLGINVREPDDLVLSYARGVELSFPLFRSTREAEQFFGTDQLPVTALVDRWGRVRGRWSGYRPAFVDEIEALARRLLEEVEPPAKVVARWSEGVVRPRVLWMRAAPALVDGLRPVPAERETEMLLVSAGRSLAVYDAYGRTVQVDENPHSAGRLRRLAPARSSPGGGYFGFRPGSPALVRFTAPGDPPRRWLAPSTILDAEAHSLPSGRETILLATMDGLLRIDAAEKEPRPVALSTRPSVSIARGPGGGISVLELGGRLVWLDETLKRRRRTAVDSDAWILLEGGANPEGVGVAPVSVRTGVAGRFLGSDDVQIALATEQGMLLLISPGDGAVLSRTHWPGITELAAGDLAGGGGDELALAQGKDVAVVSFFPESDNEKKSISQKREIDR